VDKRFNIKETDIDQQALSFKIYLKHFLLDSDSWDLLLNISQQTDVYIFSGVIRNFLLGLSENRDLDIVVKDIDKIIIPKKFWRNIRFTKNSFGGYKVKIRQLVVDVWDIEKTWGIQNMRIKSTPYSLIRTAFFNFSAITYDFNKSQFIYDEDFLIFYKTLSMDVKYSDNPNIALCILNTIYYAGKYSFYIRYDLCKWIVTHYNSNLDFMNIQLKHFNKIIIPHATITSFVQCCSDFLSIMKKDKNNLVMKPCVDIKI